MSADFRAPIAKALRAPCTFDFLGLHAQPEGTKGKRTRPAFRRLMTLLDLAQVGLLGNATDLARQFGTCTKTIYRDLEFLRSEFALPITFNGLTNEYEVAQKEAA